MDGVAMSRIMILSIYSSMCLFVFFSSLYFRRAFYLFRCVLSRLVAFYMPFTAFVNFSRFTHIYNWIQFFYLFALVWFWFHLIESTDYSIVIAMARVNPVWYVFFYSSLFGFDWSRFVWIPLNPPSGLRENILALMRHCTTSHISSRHRT